MSTLRAWVDTVSDSTENGLMVLDGYDDCIHGIGFRDRNSFVVYDAQKIINKLVESGLDNADAQARIVELAEWQGDATPAFVYLPPTQGA